MFFQLHNKPVKRLADTGNVPSVNREYTLKAFSERKGKEKSFSFTPCGGRREDLHQSFCDKKLRWSSSFYVHLIQSFPRYNKNRQEPESCRLAWHLCKIHTFERVGACHHSKRGRGPDQPSDSTYRLTRIAARRPIRKKGRGSITHETSKKK